MRVLQGNLLFTPKADELSVIEKGFVAVDEKGIIVFVGEALPEQYKGISVENYQDKLLIPGFVDIHMHSSQFPIRGIGYDHPTSYRLVHFLHPIEKKYAQIEHAKKVNKGVIDTLVENGTTRAVMMSATDLSATKDMFERLEKSGLGVLIGKMNSDYTEAEGELPAETPEVSQRETLEFIRWSLGRSELVKPIISPEFVPCCTEETLLFLGGLAREYNLPVQSHMSGSEAPNIKEILRRFPKARLYSEIYDQAGLFGQQPTLMVHCYEATKEEQKQMREKGVFLGHCPAPMMNMPPSDIFPVREQLEEGMKIGLGSDMGGGHLLDMAKVIVAAIHLSKQRQDDKPLTFTQAFYLATKGGGAFFGKVGSFEVGYEFDCLVIDDKKLNSLLDYTLFERLQRYVYCGNPSHIYKRFCKGKELK